MILASGSATRAALLSNAGLQFMIIPADIDERALEARCNADAVGVALQLAAEKALAVARLRSGDLVIGADQTLSLAGERFHKPQSREQARNQLLALMGRTHSLHSAVAAVRGSQILFRQASEARLTMRALTGREIEFYLDRAGEAARMSVGCYQVEGIGVRLFERIEGDWFTILGLPLLPLLAFLRETGETDL